MRRFAVVIILAVIPTLMMALPKIHVIATGGTIAGQSNAVGYTAGQVSIESILAAVPSLGDYAELDFEQFCNIGSQDMDERVWLRLARRVNAVLSSGGYDGVVVSHGTDTMEETAFFLNLTVHSSRPVVLVGAMRPSDAPDADGPANLLLAVQTAASQEASGREVMCCIGGKVFEAGGVYKDNSRAVDAFSAVSTDWYLPHGAETGFFVDNIDKLPEVGIVYGYGSNSNIPLRAFLRAGYSGIVLAGTGDGNFNSEVRRVAERAAKRGVAVVRSTRCPHGGVYTEGGEVDDERLGFIASGSLSPQKARILLMLALTDTRDIARIRELFHSGPGLNQKRQRLEAK